MTVAMFYAYLPWYIGGLAAWLGLLTYSILFRYPRRIYVNGLIMRPDRNWVEYDYCWRGSKPEFHFKIKKHDCIELQLGLRRFWLDAELFIDKPRDRPAPTRVEETAEDDYVMPSDKQDTDDLHRKNG